MEVVLRVGAPPTRAPRSAGPHHPARSRSPGSSDPFLRSSTKSSSKPSSGSKSSQKRRRKWSNPLGFSPNCSRSPQKERASGAARLFCGGCWNQVPALGPRPWTPAPRPGLLLPARWVPIRSHSLSLFLLYSQFPEITPPLACVGPGGASTRETLAPAYIVGGGYGLCVTVEAASCYTTCLAR
jgi:hypothetical protein